MPKKGGESRSGPGFGGVSEAIVEGVSEGGGFLRASMIGAEKSERRAAIAAAQIAAIPEIRCARTILIPPVDAHSFLLFLSPSGPQGVAGAAIVDRLGRLTAAGDIELGRAGVRRHRPIAPS